MQRLKVIFTTIVAAAISHVAIGQTPLNSPPQLVVNIVVGSMRTTDMDHYAANFGITGLGRARLEGVSCNNAEYSYQGGATPTSLATITTGTTPSIHGVTGYGWYDYTISRREDLTYDKSHRTIAYDTNQSGDSPRNLIAQTLTEALRFNNRDSRTATFALDAASAVVMNGRGGDVVWFDPNSCQWSSSTAYYEELPEWITKINKQDIECEEWELLLPFGEYMHSKDYGIVGGIERIAPEGSNLTKKEQLDYQKYEYIAYTPAGNSALLDMAWSAIQELDLGNGPSTDMVNISLDATRNIISRYGPESMEAEDMYYRLDRDIAKFTKAVTDHVKNRDVIFVLTSAGGTSRSYCAENRDNKPGEGGDQLFNAQQFAVILNTFLGAKYGTEKWVLGYENRSIFLNHELIYKKKINLEQMQSEVASFALQFRGVSHAITATALSNGYFGGSYGALIQSSYYPRRSGDVVLSLMPNWIEEIDEVRSLGGSIYGYDRNVPLLIWGAGVPTLKITRKIDVTSIAPTLAAIMMITPPDASDGERIEEIVGKMSN